MFQQIFCRTKCMHIIIIALIKNIVFTHNCQIAYFVHCASEFYRLSSLKNVFLCILKSPVRGGKSVVKLWILWEVYGPKIHNQYSTWQRELHQLVYACKIILLVQDYFLSFLLLYVDCICFKKLGIKVALYILFIPHWILGEC